MKSAKAASYRTCHSFNTVCIVYSAISFIPVACHHWCWCAAAAIVNFRFTPDPPPDNVQAVWFSLAKTKMKMVKNEKITNWLTKTKTKTKLKREYRKRLKMKTIKWKTKTKLPKQQNLSLNESGSIQYGAYGCYGRTALNTWLTVDGISADHQHVFVSRFDIRRECSIRLTVRQFTGKTKTNTETKK